MNLKVLIGFISAVAAIAAALWFLNRPSPSGSTSGGDLPSIVELEQIRNLERLEIIPAGEDPVVIAKNNTGTWILPERHRLPADFSKLERLVEALVEAETARRVTRNPDRLERLDLDQVRLRLADASATPFLDVRLGNTASSGGRYFQVEGDDAAYVTTGSLFVDTQPDGWFDKTPLDFSAESIQSVEIHWEDTHLLVARDDMDSDFSLVEASGDAAATLNSVELAEFLDNLGRIRITDTHSREGPVSEEASPYLTRVTLVPFEGETLSLSYGRRPETVTDSENTDLADPEAPEPETEPAGPAMVFLDIPQSSDNPWQAPSQSLAFEVSSFSYERFALDRDAFLIPAPAQDEAVEATPDPEDTAG